MKISTVLFVIIALQSLSTLINITIFDGEWNGIVLFLHTLLFLFAIGFFVRSRKSD